MESEDENKPRTLVFGKDWIPLSSRAGSNDECDECKCLACTGELVEILPLYAVEVLRRMIKELRTLVTEIEGIESAVDRNDDYALDEYICNFEKQIRNLNCLVDACLPWIVWQMNEAQRASPDEPVALHELLNTLEFIEYLHQQLMAGGDTESEGEFWRCGPGIKTLCAEKIEELTNVFETDMRVQSALAGLDETYEPKLCLTRLDFDAKCDCCGGACTSSQAEQTKESLRNDLRKVVTKDRRTSMPTLDCRYVIPLSSHKPFSVFQYEAVIANPSPWIHLEESRRAEAVYASWNEACEEWTRLYALRLRQLENGNYIALLNDETLKTLSLSGAFMELRETHEAQISEMLDDLHDLQRDHFDDEHFGRSWATYGWLRDDESCELVEIPFAAVCDIQRFAAVEDKTEYPELAVVIREAWQAGLRLMLSELAAMDVQVCNDRDVSALATLIDKAISIANIAFSDERDLSLRGFDESNILRWAFPALSDIPARVSADVEWIFEGAWSESFSQLVLSPFLPVVPEQDRQILLEKLGARVGRIAADWDIEINALPKTVLRINEILSDLRVRIATGYSLRKAADADIRRVDQQHQETVQQAKRNSPREFTHEQKVARVLDTLRRHDTAKKGREKTNLYKKWNKDKNNPKWEAAFIEAKLVFDTEKQQKTIAFQKGTK